MIFEDSYDFTMGGAYKTPLLRRLTSDYTAASASAYMINVPDISKWNGAVDMMIMRQKANGIIVRAGFGNEGIDSKVEENIANAKEAGLPWFLYWYIMVGYDLKKHLESFYTIYNKLGCVTPPIFDFEYTELAPKRDTTAWIDKYLSDSSSLFNRSTIYTRASWWNANVIENPLHRAFLLHVAHYTGAAFPLLPSEWDDFVLWQWSADGNRKGEEYGCTSPHLDLNRFNGGIYEFEQIFGVPPYFYQQPEPLPGQWCLQFQAISNVNIRRGAGRNYGVVGTLKPGQIVDAKNIGGKEAWIEIAPGQWCAVTYNGKPLLKKVGLE